MEEVLKLSGKLREIKLLAREPLKEVLMRRDGLTEVEAEEEIREAAAEVAEGADPEEVLAYSFGLEPDYVLDLLEYCK